MNVDPIQGTVKAVLSLGYTPEQAELVGCIDQLFERAVELEMISPADAVFLGQELGMVSGKYTGKL